MTRVLLVSGWIGNKNMFSNIIDKLEDKNVKFLEFSKVVHREDILDETLFTIKEFNPDIIIAWSMGTLAVLKALESIKVDSKLILISPIVKFTKDKNNQFGWQNKIIDSMIKTLETNKELTISKFCRNMLSSNEKEYEDLININFQFENLHTNSLIAGLEFLKETEALVDNIKNKTLLIQGEKDFICNVSASKNISLKIKNSTLTIIKSCGHIPFVTRKDDFNTTLQSFLEDKI